MNNDTPIFNDTYNGPRWRYGMNHRPLNSFSMPAGFILWSDLEHPHFRFGTVDYPRELTSTELDDYQINPVDPGLSGWRLDATGKVHTESEVSS